MELLPLRAFSWRKSGKGEVSSLSAYTYTLGTFLLARALETSLEVISCHSIGCRPCFWCLLCPVVLVPLRVGAGVKECLLVVCWVPHLIPGIQYCHSPRLKLLQVCCIGKRSACDCQLDYHGVLGRTVNIESLFTYSSFLSSPLPS